MRSVESNRARRGCRHVIALTTTSLIRLKGVLKAFYLLLMMLMGVFFSATVLAIQFSADAVMSTPGHADVSTFLYYSNGRIRKEFYYYGEPVIQILDANKHKSLMCFTEQKICYQNKSMEEIHIGIENAMTQACNHNKSLNCKNLGDEVLHKRKATKWKISASTGKKQLVSYIWMDKELNIPIKQLLSNGTRINLTWLGHEKLAQRDTDKWLQEIKLPNGSLQKSFQWFDRELKISIRETFPDGNSQELKNIMVRKLKDKLFAIPKGYELKVVRPDDADKKTKPVTTQKPLRPKKTANSSAKTK